MQWRQGRATGNQAGEEAGDVRRGEAAASDFLYRAGEPRDDDVLAGSDEFDEVARAIEKFVVVGRARGPVRIAARAVRSARRKVHRDDGWEMARPFAFHEVLIIASGDDVASANVGFVDPIFVVQDMIFATTTETAVENVVATFQREPHAFADDECARAELFAEHAKAANFCFRRDSPDDPGNGCAMPENVFSSAFDGRQSEPVVDDSEIIGQSEAFQHGMSCLDA